MRREDAPSSGWYPDPEGRDNLRYWDGLDWTDARRAPPSNAELLSYESSRELVSAHHYVPIETRASSRPGQPSAVDAQRVIEEVRQATRDEIERAADQFARRAKAMQSDFAPLISQYTNRIIKWIRFAVVAATILLVAYFVFQVVAQASLFEWIGDRIDNLTNDQNGAALGSMW